MTSSGRLCLIAWCLVGIVCGPVFATASNDRKGGCHCEERLGATKQSPQLLLNPQSIIDPRSAIFNVEAPLPQFHLYTPHKNCYILPGSRQNQLLYQV